MPRSSRHLWATRWLAPAGTLVAIAYVLYGCNSLRAPPPDFGTPPGASSPQAGAGAQPRRPAPRQYRLGPAATALVGQAHKQAAGGDFGLATATVERAMRIEPDNPLLWIELGRIRLSAGDNTQANSMGHKALVMAGGDPLAQSSAYRLIADSLRALKRNGEAADADRRADALSPR